MARQYDEDHDGPCDDHDGPAPVDDVTFQEHLSVGGKVIREGTTPPRKPEPPAVDWSILGEDAPEIKPGPGIFEVPLSVLYDQDDRAAGFSHEPVDVVALEAAAKAVGIAIRRNLEMQQAVRKGFLEGLGLLPESDD